MKGYQNELNNFNDTRDNSTNQHQKIMDKVA